MLIPITSRVYASVWLRSLGDSGGFPGYASASSDLKELCLLAHFSTIWFAIDHLPFQHSEKMHQKFGIRDELGRRTSLEIIGSQIVCEQESS